MSERPFMQLYVSDFIGDTLALTTEQLGAYMLLLMAMWNAGGSLTNDDAKLARICRLSVKKWRGLADDVLAYFEESDGQLTHNRLTKELHKSERKSQSRASAGAKGGSAKALKNKEEVLANATVLQQHLPDTIIREDTIVSSKNARARDPASVQKNDQEFDRFWDAYPHKVGKKPSRQAFQKALRVASFFEIMDGLERYKLNKPPDRSWLNPITFLNQQRWQDIPAENANERRGDSGYRSARPDPLASAIAKTLERDRSGSSELRPSEHYCHAFRGDWDHAGASERGRQIGFGAETKGSHGERPIQSDSGFGGAVVRLPVSSR